VESFNYLETRDYILQKNDKIEFIEPPYEQVLKRETGKELQNG
jgi:hypothetical protein